MVPVSGACVMGNIKQTSFPTSTQPSIHLGYVNRIPACQAGVKAGCVHLCQVADNTVISYGK